MSDKNDEQLPSADVRLVTGSDGLLNRVVDEWAEQKLHYLRRYMDIMSTGMKNMWPRLVYIDLFSGFGRSTIENSKKEIYGSPLIALSESYPFTHYYLNDSHPGAVDTLRKRIDPVRSNVNITNLDCNEAARVAGAAAFGSAERTLALAFIDPTGFQIEFDAIADMTRNRNVDLIITFMSDHLRRFIAKPALEPSLDSFFGSREWRQLVDLRKSGETLTYRRLLDHYKERLNTLGYQDVDDHLRITRSNGRTLYHLVFASRHPRGADFFRKISRKDSRGQQQLDLDKI